MNQSCLIEIDFTEKAKLWLSAAYFSLLVMFTNIVSTLWKRSANITHHKKPLPYHAGHEIGNHMHIKINGVKFHYVEQGASHLPVLLLLHGFPDFWIGWRHQIKGMATDFRVIALDLKGFGDSDKPQWRCSYQVSNIIEELELFIEAVGVKSCFLVGHDLGALIGWCLAARNPSKILKFVSISCPHPNLFWENKPNAEPVHSRFNQICLAPYLPESFVRKDNLLMFDSMYKHLSKTGELSLLQSYKYVFSREEDLCGPIHYLRNLMFTRLSETKIIVPVLILVGGRDPYVADQDFIRSTAFTHHAEIKIIEDTGHFPHQEKWSEVNEIIIRFLRDVPSQEINEKTTRDQGFIRGWLKYGNTLVDTVKKSAPATGWRPRLL